MSAAIRTSDQFDESEERASLPMPGDVLLRALPLLDDEQQFRSAFDDAALGMSIASLDFRLLRVNAAHCEMLGHSERELLTTDFRTRIHPDDLAPNDDLRANLFAGVIDSYAVERRYFHKRGHIVWCIVTVSLVRDAYGRPLYFVGQMQDISERKRAEAELRASQQRMAQVLASSSDGILIVDRTGRVTTANAALERITALPTSALIGCASDALPWVIQQPDGSTISPGQQPVQQVLSNGASVSGLDVQFVHPDGTLVHATVDTVPLFDQTDALDGAVMTVHDVTEQKNLEHRLEQLALHDGLTGLPNRRHFEDCAERAMADARRDDTTVSILFVDLDGFKPINDQLGHAAGDQVLIEVARRLVASVGEIGCVARMGGDEFAILLEGPSATASIPTIEQRMTAACAAPYRIDGHTVHVTPSIGVGTMTDADDRLGDMLHRADSAMYEAKRAQRTHHRRSGDPVVMSTSVSNSKTNSWKLFGLHVD